MTAGRTFIISLATALVVTIAGLFVAMNLWSSKVPVLRFMDVQAARAVASSHGFSVWVVAEEDSLSVPAGNVLDQAPNDGKRALKGSTIMVRVSAGKATEKPAAAAAPGTGGAAVPPVVGAPLATARVTLEQAGLKVGAIKKELSDKAADIVVKADPEAGVPLPRGSAVNLVVSSGQKMGKVPKVTMKGLNRARKLLEDAGFKVGPVRSASNEDYAFGWVLTQNPRAGDEVPLGTEVELVVNRESE
jgi:serine/threonine-protein kinase